MKSNVKKNSTLFFSLIISANIFFFFDKRIVFNIKSKQFMVK